MNELDLSPLDRLATQTKTKQVAEIGPAEPVDVTRKLLAFDQSVANTGWVYMIGITPIYTGNIKTHPISKGHEDTLSRVEVLFAETRHLIGQYEPAYIVHELPPVGSRMVRPEASLSAAVAVRCAAQLSKLPVLMVGAQKAKKRLTGNGNADKAAVRQAIKRLYPSVVNLKPLNEAIYDAIALGWMAAEMEIGG